MSGQTLQPNSLLQGRKYKIVRHLSSGGFGNVYEGVHLLLKKRVAIKEFFIKDFCNRNEATAAVTADTTVKAPLVNKLKSKFIEEAQSVSTMAHPHIVKVTDVFEENGTAYYVMDYIDGASLNDIVKNKGALSEQQAIKYILQVADALQYVHSKNRLHLDIKPGNIMVDKDDNAILIDFGTSKQYDEADGENTSTLLGVTPSYAPLEQQANNVSKFSPATDIYSLGATLYKLLTGKKPIDATLMASGEQLQPLPKSISKNVRKAVRKAMLIKKDERPQSIKAFTQELNPNETPKALLLIRVLLGLMIVWGVFMIGAWIIDISTNRQLHIYYDNHVPGWTATKKGAFLKASYKGNHNTTAKEARLHVRERYRNKLFIAVQFGFSIFITGIVGIFLTCSAKYRRRFKQLFSHSPRSLQLSLVVSVIGPFILFIPFWCLYVNSSYYNYKLADNFILLLLFTPLLGLYLATRKKDE